MKNWLKNNFIIILSVLFGIFVLVFFNAPFIHQQYGYDQAVYLYEGKALSLGDIPYRQVWDQRMFGLGYIFAVMYKIGFESPVSFRVLEIIWMSMTVIVLAGVLKMIVKNKYAVASGAIFFALILGNHGFYGYDEGYVEIFMLLPVVLGLLFMLFYERNRQSRWLILAGFSIFAVFMFRISGIALFLPVIFYLYLTEKSSDDGSKVLWKLFARKLSILIAAFFLPLLSYILYLGVNGALGDFYDALVRFNSFYGSTIPELKIANATFYTKVLYSTNNLFSHLETFPLTYLIVIIGIIVLFRRHRLIDYVILLYLLVEILSVTIGLKPWPHYFIQLYPFIAILASYIVLSICDEVFPVVKKYKFVQLPLLIIIVFFFVYPYILQPFSKSVDKLQAAKQNFNNGKIAAVEDQVANDPVAIYAREHFQPGDYAVYWSSFYLYQATGMKSSTRYFSNVLCNYWGMQNGFVTQNIIDNFLSDMRANPPKIFVLNREEFDAISPILKYIDSNYKLIPSISNGTYQAYGQ